MTDFYTECLACNRKWLTGASPKGVCHDGDRCICGYPDNGDLPVSEVHFAPFRTVGRQAVGIGILEPKEYTCYWLNFICHTCCAGYQAIAGAQEMADECRVSLGIEPLPDDFLVCDACFDVVKQGPFNAECDALLTQATWKRQAEA